MKNATKLLLVAIVILLVSTLESKKSSTTENYDDVLLVTNLNSPESIEIGDYFQQKRNVIHRVYIETSPTEQINLATFTTTIREPIEQYLIENDIVYDINYIVTTKGVPLRLVDSVGGRKAIDSMLGIILSSGADKIGLYAAVHQNPLKHLFRYEDLGLRDMEPINNYVRGDEFSKLINDVYVVTRLTGYTVEDAKSLVTDNICNNMDGKILMDGWTSQGRDIMESIGYDVIWDSKGNGVLKNFDDVDFYTSWGSHDGSALSYTWNLSFNDGSLGTIVDSTCGRSFMEGTPYGQTLVADLISMGISGVAGYTSEPLVDNVIKPEHYLSAYMQYGYNLGQSLTIGVTWYNYVTVLVGDPKLKVCNPIPVREYSYSDFIQTTEYYTSAYRIPFEQMARKGNLWVES